MPINRDLWQSEISADHVPNWPCPGCGAASLLIVKDSFRTVLDGEGSRNWDQPDFDPVFDTGRFVCLLVCTKTGCGESCAVSGNYDIAEGYTEQGYPIYYATGRPTSITPPPPMILIPRACPDPVRAEVVAAFSLYWNDLASSLNRIRNALELVLDDLKIPKSTLDKVKKKKHRLSLHHRIVKLKQMRPRLKDICERMMAVKHLGNAGSHPGVKVEAADVFDGFNILERVLQDMYSEDPGELARAVRQINRRKGPRKARD
jgi:Domain of unknown function (DUF4145)